VFVPCNVNFPGFWPSIRVTVDVNLVMEANWGREAAMVL
jgi:hypothetical protein